MLSIRGRILNRCFNLLYGPLVFLHEPAGVCLFGAAWRGRRQNVLDGLDTCGILLDVGCGAGHLLALATQQGYRCLGVDRSIQMLQRARGRETLVVQGDARTLPLANGAVASIVITYPGPWIRDAATWSELERVLRPGGQIVVLLGGTLEARGGSRFRRLLIPLAYGRVSGHQFSFDPPLMEKNQLEGRLRVCNDAWGQVFRWEGTRI